MTVVVDTNVLVQLLGRNSPLPALRRALEQGRVEWAVSTPVMMEYEEVIVRLAGAAAWEMAARMMELIRILRGTIRQVSPSFRFRTITGDPDDDAFADCAIVAEADWIITSDRHFDMLRGAGYKPQPIRQEEFIQRFLRT
jgi:putative PIN family toxin of toxin-antitoxin system